MYFVKSLFNHPRAVLHALEGSGKSSAVFQELNKITTGENPVLFVCRNYKLMEEQIDNWSSRFNVPLENFAITAFTNEAEHQKYFTYEQSHIIPHGVRFVFTTQNTIQRDLQHKIVYPDHSSPAFSCVIVDEFDLFSGVIPNLDYLCHPISAGKKAHDESYREYINQQFSRRDQLNLKYSKDDFYLASWLESPSLPLYILTSETLAANFLHTIGFHLETFGQHSFPDYKLNVYSSSNLDRFFYSCVQDSSPDWSSLGFDHIITDKLDGSIITNHTSCRGSNDYYGSLLMFISHLPTSIIRSYQKALKYFGVDTSEELIEVMYYRDRLCQSAGRVLGYRSSRTRQTVVHCVIHSRLSALFKKYEHILPYNFDDSWFPKYDWLDESFARSIQKRALYNETQKDNYYQDRQAQLNSLDKIFKLNPDSFLTVSQVKDALSEFGLSFKANTVALHFALKVSQKRIQGKRVKVINGLSR